MQRTQEKKSRFLLLAALVGAAVLLVGGTVDLVAETWSPLFRRHSLWAGGLGALAFLGLAAPLEASAARAAGPKGRVDLWRALAVTAAALAVEGCHEVSYVFENTWYLFVSTGRLSVLEPDAFAVPAAATLAAGLFSFLAAPSPRALRRAVWGTAALTLAMLLAVGLRAGHAPAPEAYLASRPLAGVLPAVVPDPAPPGRSPEVSSRFEDQRVGDLLARRFVFGFPLCGLALGRDPSALPERMAWVGSPQTTCDALELRRDRTGTLLLVRRFSGGGPLPVVFETAGTSARPVPVSEATLALFRGQLAAPLGWLVPAGLLWALGLLVLRPRWSLVGWLADRARWRSGTLDGDGRVHLDDGSVRGLSYRTALRPGAVVLRLPAEPEGQTPFREGPVAVLPPEDVRQGSVAEVQADLEAQLDAHRTRAVACFLFSLALTLPWALQGLVF